MIFSQTLACIRLRYQSVLLHRDERLGSEIQQVRIVLVGYELIHPSNEFHVLMKSKCRYLMHRLQDTSMQYQPSILQEFGNIGSIFLLS